MGIGGEGRREAEQLSHAPSPQMGMREGRVSSATPLQLPRGHQLSINYTVLVPYCIIQAQVLTKVTHLRKTELYEHLYNHSSTVQKKNHSVLCTVGDDIPFLSNSWSELLLYWVTVVFLVNCG